MAVGGDILQINYTHPTVGNGILFPKAGEDNTFDPGGFRSMDTDDAIDGGGNMIDTMNRKRWSFEVSISADENTNKEMEQLFNLCQSTVQANWVITHINGTVWSGKGKFVGDLKLNGNTALIPLKISGGKLLQQI